MSLDMISPIVGTSAFISAFIFLVTIYAGLMDYLSGNHPKHSPLSWQFWQELEAYQLVYMRVGWVSLFWFLLLTAARLVLDR